MNKLSCIILEDDDFALKILEGLVTKSGLLELIQSFSSPSDAIPWLMDHNVDVIFLDVEMPGMSGLDMLKTLDYKPEVIVISGKADYAVEAFNLNVTDYLVKPINDYPRFITSIKKVIAKRSSKNLNVKKEEYLFVKINNLLQKIELSTIDYVEAFGDYIKIKTIDQTQTVYSTLKKIEDKLDSDSFVRIHRSFIVNVNKISNIDPHNLEINKKIIPISSSYKNDLMNKIKIL